MVGSEGERRVGKDVREFKSRHGQKSFFFNFLFFQKEYFWGLIILTDKYLYLNMVDLTVLGQILYFFKN